MPDPAALAQAGPWAVVIAIGLGLAVGFVRGWVVPGFVYQREVKRGDDATASVTALTESIGKDLRDLTEEIRWDRHGRLSRPPDAGP